MRLLPLLKSFEQVFDWCRFIALDYLSNAAHFILSTRHDVGFNFSDRREGGFVPVVE